MSGTLRVTLAGYYGMYGILLRSLANLPEHVFPRSLMLLAQPPPPTPFLLCGRKKSQPKIAGWGATGARAPE